MGSKMSNNNSIHYEKQENFKCEGNIVCINNNLNISYNINGTVTIYKEDKRSKTKLNIDCTYIINENEKKPFNIDGLEEIVEKNKPTENKKFRIWYNNRRN